MYTLSDLRGERSEGARLRMLWQTTSQGLRWRWVDGETPADPSYRADGGLSAPVIRPAGHVYAIASSNLESANLLVFPQPIKPIFDQGTAGTACNGVGGQSPGNYHP